MNTTSAWRIISDTAGSCAACRSESMSVASGTFGRAGNESRLRLANNLGHGGILRGLPIGKNECCHRIQLAQSVDVGVVGVALAGTEDEEVTTVALLTKPAKRFVKVATASHHGNSGRGLGLDVVLVPDAKVLIGTAMSETRRQQ